MMVNLNLRLYDYNTAQHVVFITANMLTHLESVKMFLSLIGFQNCLFLLTFHQFQQEKVTKLQIFIGILKNTSF